MVFVKTIQKIHFKTVFIHILDMHQMTHMAQIDST